MLKDSQPMDDHNMLVIKSFYSVTSPALKLACNVHKSACRSCNSEVVKRKVVTLQKSTPPMTTSRTSQPHSFHGRLLRKVKQVSLLAATLILVAGRLNAIPITGEVHFVGSFSPTGGTGLADATGLSFGPGYVLTSSGSFSSLGAFSMAIFNSFDFAPLSPGTLWSAGGFSFSLQDITIDLQSATQLNLSGSGMLTGPGNFDPTPGTWNFQGGGSQGFTFRTDNNASVPDGSNTVLLFGIALAGLGAGLRIQKLTV